MAAAFCLLSGFKLKFSERSYFPEIDDPELQLVLFRSQEIPRYVEDGVLDAGICGQDWVVETGTDVVEVSIPAIGIFQIMNMCDSKHGSPGQLCAAALLLLGVRGVKHEQRIMKLCRVSSSLC
jgi:hypothetical protein